MLQLEGKTLRYAIDECGRSASFYNRLTCHEYIEQPGSLLGLRFDMTIYRCCGTLSDIPNYTKYLVELNALYRRYANYILNGKFVDNEGFTSDNPYVLAKGWRDAAGGIAVTLWNPTSKAQRVTLRNSDTAKMVDITLPPEKATAAEL
ncbi:hypothetical protein AGMMS49992_27250 [Clostridia bacterium]|nr:hypothetical protein AGMMS49992_27250 [Clostridia bacterium]